MKQAPRIGQWGGLGIPCLELFQVGVKKVGEVLLRNPWSHASPYAESAWEFIIIPALSWKLPKPRNLECFWVTAIPGLPEEAKTNPLGRSVPSVRASWVSQWLRLWKCNVTGFRFVLFCFSNHHWNKETTPCEQAKRNNQQKQISDTSIVEYRI